MRPDSWTIMFNINSFSDSFSFFFSCYTDTDSYSFVHSAFSFFAKALIPIF